MIADVCQPVCCPEIRISGEGWGETARDEWDPQNEDSHLRLAMNCIAVAEFAPVGHENCDVRADTQT